MNELERLGLDDNFGLAYDNELMQKKMINTARNWGYDDGKEAGARAKEIEDDGKEAGARAKEIEIAKNFLKDCIPIEVVSRNTGLSVEELEELKKEA